MGTVAKDLRYAVRVLAKSPGFTAVIILSLALGLGANTAIFSLVNAYLLRPMPVEDPDRLVAIYSTAPRWGNGIGNVSYPDVLDYRKQETVFSDLMGSTGVALSVTDGERPELIWGEIVTGNFFSGLGIHPVVGRGFLPDEDRAPGEKAVCVLNYNFWMRRYHGDTGVAGRTIQINGHTFTIVGVAPRGFIGTTLFQFVPDVWVPAMMQTTIAPGDGNFIEQRGNRWVSLRGRLKPGVSVKQAEAALNVVAQQLAKSYPKTNGDLTMHAIPGGARVQPWMVANGVISSMTGIMIAVVALVLFIACANVANLMLARSSTRAREMAIRIAVGASRARLVRQLLTESVLLAVAGGLLGILFALWFNDLLGGFYPSLDFQTADLEYEMQFDPRLFLFTGALSMITAIVFGLVPALRASKVDQVTAMKGQSTANPGRRGGGYALVMGQVALSCTLLICGGLFLRSMQFARNADPGFDRTGITMFSLNLDLQGYKEPRGRIFQHMLLDRLRGVPGVAEVSIADPLPLGPYDTSVSVYPAGYIPRSDREENSVGVSYAGPRYFAAMNTAIVAGRPIDERDTDLTSPVAVINETFARRYWNSAQAAVGRKFSTRRDGPAIEVVGVARNGKYTTFGEPATPYLFLPLWQDYKGRFTVLVRSKEDAGKLMSAIRQEIKALDPALPVFGVRTMPEFLSRMVSIYDMGASLIGTFAMMALLLAAVGIYGVVHFTVSRRTREIGIRMAIGANRIDVLQLVLQRAISYVFLGIALGLAFSAFAGRFTGSLLAGVDGRDPLTFVAVAGFFGVIGLIASLAPAKRATRVDPVVALRYE